MDKPEKEVKSKGEIIRLFNTKVVNSEKVVSGGKTMYMTIDKIDDSGKEVKRKKNTKSKIREKQGEMNQTLNFPDDIDYQQFGDLKLPLHIDEIDKSKANNFLNSERINDYFERLKSENPLEKLVKGPKEFTKLSEVEEHLQQVISSFSNIEDISDKKLRNIFHTIQMWGGWEGRYIYFNHGGFEKNFDIETYRKLVQRCLSFEKDGDWVQRVSKWTFESHKSYWKKKKLKGGINNFNISFSTKHVRYWLFKKLKENSLPIYDQVLRGGLNKYNPDYPLKDEIEDLTRYWKQMIEKSEKEKITLEKLERILFNYFTIQLENHKKVKKIIKKIIRNSFKSEIKKFPRGKSDGSEKEQEQFKHFNYLVDEIALYINKYLVKEEEYEEIKEDFEKLIEFAFQGRNTPKYYGSMEELFEGFKR